MRIYLVSLGLALFVWSVPLAAKAWEDGHHGIQFQVDEEAGWNVEGAQPDKNLLFMAIVPDDPHGRNVMLIWQPVSPGAESLNKTLIRNFEAGHGDSVKQAGGKITKLRSRRLEIDGVPAYEALFRVEQNDRQLMGLWRLVLANGKIYILVGQALDLEVDKDPKVLALMDSFKFTKPPRFPPADQAGAGGGIVNEQSEAYKMGYLVGRITVLLLVLAFVFSFVRRLIKKRK